MAKVLRVLVRCLFGFLAAFEKTPFAYGGNEPILLMFLAVFAMRNRFQNDIGMLLFTGWTLLAFWCVLEANMLVTNENAEIQGSRKVCNGNHRLCRTFVGAKGPNLYVALGSSSNASLGCFSFIMIQGGESFKECPYSVKIASYTSWVSPKMSPKSMPMSRGKAIFMICFAYGTLGLALVLGTG